MLISLQQLDKRPFKFDLEIPVGEIEYDSKLTQASPLLAEGGAQLLDHSLGEIRLVGKLAVTVNGTCDRCLELATFPIATNFDLIYMPAGEQGAGDEEVEAGATEVGFYEGSGLELYDVLREVVLLALPMRLVCREDCKGICPICGQNRNQNDCACQVKPVDDRWSKLKLLQTEAARPR